MGLALFIAVQSEFGLISLSLFFLVLLAIYFSEMPERERVRVSFWLVPLIALIAMRFLSAPWIFLAALLSLLAFFICLGLSHLLFKNQFLFYEILNTILIFSLTALYFGAAGKGFWGNIIFFAAIGALFNETFEFFGFMAKKRKFLSSAVLGFIALELGWVLSFLPLGALNSAAYLTFTLILIRDGLTVYRGGLLSRNFFLRELIFLIILSVAIFAATNWRI